LDQAQGQAIAFGAQNSARQGASASASVAPTLDKSKVPGVGYGMQVRRLTPRECERLQGFPDGYTAIPYRGKPSADGPRYKALGNSMAVPVMRWIGERIAAVEQLSIQAVSAA
jgi:DNA (cytosine-5)-methyltransferase 1